MTILRALADLEERGEEGVLCTIVFSQGSTPRHTGSKMLVYPDGNFIGTVGGGEMESRVIHEALDALSSRKAKKLNYSMVDPKAGDPGVCGGNVEIFVEPILGSPVLLVIGAGHVGKAVSHLGKWLGFRVVVSDDRAEFCTAEVNPDADEFIIAPLKDLPALVKFSANTYVVLTTRGVPIDVPGMPALLAAHNGYIGVIGSKKRWLATRKALLELGIGEERLNQVYSPIGIELGAETPEEIAVSIMAEILMQRNQASGKRMRYQG